MVGWAFTSVDVARCEQSSWFLASPLLGCPSVLCLCPASTVLLLQHHQPATGASVGAEAGPSGPMSAPLCWEVGEVPRDLGAHSWGMGWAFLGSFSLKLLAFLELLLLFSLFISPFCFFSLEKTLCVSIPSFFVFLVEVLDLCNPSAPSASGESHGSRPPLLPA